MLINETLTMAKPTLIESNDKGQLPKGVLCRVTYPICNIGERNANNRIYEDAVWEGVFGSEDLMNKIGARALFGHAEHPEQTQSNLEKTSHVICEMWKEGNTVYQKIDVLDTPTGRIVGTLLEAGCNVGMSTRADGDLEESSDDDGKFSRVIPESYHYITTDFTADPSTFGAVPQDVQHNITQEARRQLKNENLHEGERQFAQMICESFESMDKDKEVKKLTIKECLDTKQIVEGSIIKNGEADMTVSITEGKMTLTIGGEEVAADGDGYVAIQKDGTMYLCPESGPVGEEMPMVDEEPPTSAEPDMDAILPDEEEIADELDAELGVEDDEEDELPESKEEPEAEEVIEEADEVKDDAEPVEEAAEEEADVEEAKKKCDKCEGECCCDKEPVEEAAEEDEEELDFVDLQVQEASMRAERDKALELLETQSALVTDVKAKWREDRVFEIKVLSKKLKEARESHTEQEDSLSAVIVEHETTIAGLKSKLNESTSLVESTTQTTADAASKLEEKVTVLEAAKVDATKASDKAMADLTESHAAEMGSKIEEAKTAVGANVTSDFVKRFIRIRVKESNLRLSRNSQTLLEECRTLEEVDSLMEEIVDAKRRRSALHTNVSEHKVHKPAPVDPETAKVKTLMEGVFKGMGER